MRGAASRASLTFLVAAFLLLALIEVELLAAGSVRPAWIYSLPAGVGLVYALTGILAWSRRPANRTGGLLVFGGLAWLISGLHAAEMPTLAALGQIFKNIPVAVAIHLLLVFPSGRAGHQVDRFAIGLTYVMTIVFQAPEYLFEQGGLAAHPLFVSSEPTLADAGTAARSLAGIGLCVVVLLSLLRRLREAAPSQRRALEPFAIYGIFAVFAIPILSNLLAEPLGLSDNAIKAIQLIVLAGLPFATLATMMRGGFARMMAIEELAADLGELGELADLAPTVARTLGDATATVGFEVAPGRLVDGAGEPAQWPAPKETGRGICSLELAGGAKAWIFYDSHLIADPKEVEAAARVLLIWFERERLNVTLRASQRELRRSRREIAQAADAERRRIARDLHDGLASRLVLTAIKIQRIAGSEADRDQTRRYVEEAQRDLELAIRELRELVQGLVPSGLIEGGLVAAAHDLADGVGTGAQVVVDDDFRRPSPEIESAAYFVIAEAVANAVRHSGARQIEIYLGATERLLELRVTDDGDGGATERAAGAGAGGSGIRGMRQRIETFDGQFRLVSRPGEGTEVRASLPLVSPGSDAPAQTGA